MPLMPDARARLTRLIELATQRAPEKQRALAFELCDLLLEWPNRYPSAMREPFEVLLEKVLRRLDGTTRRMIAGRFAERSDAALALLNEIYLDLPDDARAAVLRRNEQRDDGNPTSTGISDVDEMRLLAGVRSAPGAEFTVTFADILRIPATTAERILADRNRSALAVACKGAHVTRPVFSAIAVLSTADRRTDATACLAAFDEISQGAAENLLDYWRQTHEDLSPLPTDVAAA
jgi:hypothetical protein